jgi:hypothetical protein
MSHDDDMRLERLFFVFGRSLCKVAFKRGLDGVRGRGETPRAWALGRDQKACGTPFLAVDGCPKLGLGHPHKRPPELSPGERRGAGGGGRPGLSPLLGHG